MQKFTYTVVNAENKQLTGSISAETEADARKELNSLGFSIITLTDSFAGETPLLNTTQSEENAESASEIIKFEFSGTDKNQKKISGTIQGPEIYLVFKRLVKEFQFQVDYLYQSDLDSESIKREQSKGVAELYDRLAEEDFLNQNAAKQKEISEQEFAEKQAAMKKQIEYVLTKINEILTQYQSDLDPQTKQKIKYFVDKILRIKNSTNLEYIRHTCEEMLDYIQKAELFLHQEQRIKEKNQLAVEAKSMMIELHAVGAKGQQDIFEAMRDWRQKHIIENPAPTPSDNLINFFLTFIIGARPDSPEIIEARYQLQRTKKQIKDFFIIYLQSPNKEFKAETMLNIKRLGSIKKEQQKRLHDLIETERRKMIDSGLSTSGEILLREIFKLLGWIFCFYLIYYYLSIYISTKEINLGLPAEFPKMFQTSIIKYFFTALFIAVSLIGLRLEFFRKHKGITPILLFVFIFSNILIVLNF